MTTEGKEKEKEKKIPLVECFGPTIQGEGQMIGYQTYFLRFGLCDYKCKLCDSMHAVDPVKVKENAEWLTQEQIAGKFLDHASHHPDSTYWITLSGGNPCIHELGQLITLLKQQGYMIALETQGTFCPDWVLQCDKVTISPKGQGIGEKIELSKLDMFINKFLDEHLSYKLSLKVPVFDQRDLELASMLVTRYGGIIHYDRIFLSLGNPLPPNEGEKPVSHPILTTILIGLYKQLLEDIVKDPVLRHVRFLPQWHVFVWGNDKGR